MFIRLLFRIKIGSQFCKSTRGLDWSPRVGGSKHNVKKQSSVNILRKVRVNPGMQVKWTNGINITLIIV